MPDKLHVAIIGGGVAGFFAAIAAKKKRPEADVTIFEKNRKVLAKVEVTGGGRDLFPYQGATPFFPALGVFCERP